ncbi:hypothetical protein BLNAU_13691 [Blattamonas nauphoetae]|uniref:Uncharacterized protein n=1 Tax=Blattamonas nauphoetae TaxID=2049346 RepID=A0ABQ9XG17_9EUKA|nr:hypothetical protein BLNAU_13691 [Blattamonas nauphoetae]
MSPISEQPGNVSIIGTCMKDSQNVLTGGLVPGMSLFSSFFVANTSILRCLTNTVATTENNPSMTHTDPIASHTFINCTWTEASSNTNGGAINADNKGSLSLSSCTFRKCNCTNPSSGSGGGVFFFGNGHGYRLNSDLPYERDSTHSNILFNSNTARRGGAILYSATSGTPMINWFSCIFFNNTATLTKPNINNMTHYCSAGNDLFFYEDRADWNNTLARPGAFTNCFSNSQNPRIAINYATQFDYHTICFPNGSLLSDIFPEPSLIVSTRAEASNEGGCGMNYFLPCKTLGYVGANQLSSSTGEVLVEAGQFTESIDGYNLDLKFMSFIVAGQTVVRHEGTGQVSIESCSFVGKESGDATSSHIISTTTGSLSVTNTHFSSLKVGAGALLRWETSGSISLTDLFFLNLETTQSAPLTIIPAASLSLSGLYFEKCVGASFSDLIVDPSALSQISTIPSSLSTSVSPRASQKDGHELTQRPSYQIAVDGNEGLDEPFCWIPMKKCRSVGRLVDRLGYDFEGEIVVAVGESIEAGIVLVQTQSLVITGASHTDSIVQLKTSTNSLLIIPSTSTLSLSSLTLTLPSSQTSSPVISSSGTLSITSVTFALSSQHTDHSASIISVMSETTALTSCSFDGEDEQIGSFISIYGGSISVSESTFSNVKMKSSFVAGGGNLVLKGNSFSSLVDSTESGSTNVMRVTIGANQKLEITKTDTKSSEFVSCSSKGNGGALNIALLSSGTLAISHTSFTSCSSAVNGGALFVDLSASTSASTSFSSLVFGSGSDVNTAILGSKVFVKSRNLKTDADGVLIGLKPTLSGSLLTTAEKNVFVSNSTSPESLLFFWYPHIDSSGAVHVHSDGEDHTNCGLFELACKTLSHSFTSLKTTRTITLNPVSWIWKSLILTVPVLSTSLFDVKYGIVEFESTCTLVNPSSTAHTSSLFSLSSGTLKLDNTSLDFSNRFVSSHPLFTQTGGSLTLSGMSIENVTRSNGDGSVISSTISSGSLSISECQFSSCVCSSGNGGVMNVELSGTATFAITGTTTFSLCRASGDGNLIHLTRSDLVSFLGGSQTGPLDAIRPNTTSEVAFTSEVHEEFWGIDTNAVSPSTGSLLFYWYPHTTGSVRVTETGTDHPNCGLIELPCSSLDFGHDRLKETGKDIVISSAASLSTSLKPAFAAETIISLSTPQIITLSSNGQIKTDTANTQLTLTTLQFALELSQARSSSVFSVSAGSLVLSGCTFGSSTAPTSLTSSVVSVSGGTFQMIDNSVIQNMSSAHPILSLVGGTTTLVSTTVHSLALTSTAAIVLNDGNLRLEDSSFSSITNTEGDGSVLSAVVSTGKKVSIDSGTISDCSTKGNGGALHVSLVGTGCLEMKGTNGMNFEKCSADVGSRLDLVPNSFRH